jgi:hypothetical protein
MSLLQWILSYQMTGKNKVRFSQKKKRTSSGFLHSTEVFRCMTTIQKKIKLLLVAVLVDQPQKTIKAWFKEALEHAVENEKYRLAAKLQKAELRYKEQLKKRNKK